MSPVADRGTPAVGHTWGVQRPLGDGWWIELSAGWAREHAKDGVTAWRAPGRTMRVWPAGPWRCADGADIIASLDAELPPDPTGKVGEAGRDGIGHRAAWLYRQGGDVKFTLYGYNFVDRTYLETVFSSADTDDIQLGIRRLAFGGSIFRLGIIDSMANIPVVSPGDQREGAGREPTQTGLDRRCVRLGRLVGGRAARLPWDADTTATG